MVLLACKVCFFLYFYIHTYKTILFHILADTVYLDHAGTTLYSDQQIHKVTQDLLENTFGNPHILFIIILFTLFSTFNTKRG